MFCSDCGAETSDQASFCPRCGHDLGTQRAHASVEAALVEVSGRSGFWRRFAAHAIDVAIVWFAIDIVWGTFLNTIGYLDYRWIEGFGVLAWYFFSSPLVSQSYIAGLELPYFPFYSDADWWLNIGAVIFVPLAAVLAYYVIGTAKWGRTLGKAALGIRVVGPDGTPPGIVRTIIRETVGKFLSGIFWIGFLMAAGKQKRGLHDRISGTQVEVTGWNWLKREHLTQEDAR